MYTFFLDESGKEGLAKVDPNSPHFVMGGIIVKDGFRNWMRHVSEFVKIKYWNDKERVFHASSKNDLSDDEGANFTNDMVHFMGGIEFHAATNIVNKSEYIKSVPGLAKAIKKAPNEAKFRQIMYGQQKKVVITSASTLLSMFIYFLKERGEGGTVVVEATGSEQDRFIFDAYNQFLHSGHPGLELSIIETRKILTSISFVTKLNQDIEMQIADMLVNYSNLEARQKDGILTTPDNHKETLLKLFHAKSFQYKKTVDPTEQPLDSFYRQI